MNYRNVVCAATLLAITTIPAQAGWLDRLQEEILGGESAAVTRPGLLPDEIAGGLREALERGVRTAVAQLGQPDGFFAHPRVRIPLPEHLQRLSGGLRMLGQGQYVDAFELTMNRAAEAAVPEAATILVEAVRNMTLEDARKILNGADDAATQYFRRVGEERLRARLRPLIAQATRQAEVTRAYNDLTKSLAFLGDAVDTRPLDLDRYVTGKALEGLFLMIAEEERRIRQNPAARTSELLRKVFGAGGGSATR